MKNFFKDFLHRGLLAAAGGPVVLGIIYYILGATGEVTTLPATEVATGILTITLMAFIAAGMTGIYQTERLPLISKILLHAAVLYIDYLLMYLINDWIPKEGIIIFTTIFIIGFAAIWLVIYATIKHKANKINQKLNK